MYLTHNSLLFIDAKLTPDAPEGTEPSKPALSVLSDESHLSITIGLLNLFYFFLCSSILKCYFLALDKPLVECVSKMVLFYLDFDKSTN